RAQTTQAQGNVQAAQAAIATAQAALKTAQEGVPLAEAQLKQAQAKLTQAKTDADRYQKLYAAGAVSAEERDSYQTSYEVAQQQLEVAQQQVNQAQTQLTQAQTQLNQAQAEAKTQQGGLEQVQADVAKTQVSQQQSQVADAQINQAQAQVQAAQLQLSHTQISAPAAGRVAQKNVEVGEQVQTGQALLAIVGTDPWIIANFKETQVARMQPGQPVTITIDALPGQRFDGTVTSLAPGTGSEFALLPADNATGNFTKVTQRVPIKVEFNPQSLGSEASRVVPGLSVEVRVKVK
ncbi:MAG: efflux RND transporter periplasmic adaptor subunit, partial [Cyanobacteria bacterium P01_H01_bin.121]